MRLPVDEAFRKYADRVFGAAFSVCRDRADADDVVQNTFIKYHNLELDYRDEEHLRAWLLRVAINGAKDAAASFWRRNRTAWEDSSWKDYMNELAFPEEEDSRLFRAVMDLPRKYRVVIHLFYYEEYSVAQIAQLLHSREGTVKSQLSRGRKLLKQTLQEEWDDDE